MSGKWIGARYRNQIAKCLNYEMLRLSVESYKIRRSSIQKIAFGEEEIPSTKVLLTGLKIKVTDKLTEEKNPTKFNYICTGKP